ncbi:MAG: HAD family phosphatase [Gammaproteobacteria bacterium]|jgi:putative hydrolase of the HAD superfamily
MPISSANIDAVVFDLGNVLVEIDFKRVFARWAQYAQCPPEKIAKRYAHDHHYEKHERGEIDAREYFAALRESLGINITDEQFLEGWNQIFVGEVPSIRHMIRRYAALFPIYAFSNSNEAHKTVWLPRYSQLLQPFKEVFISCQMGKRKPELEAYLHVANAIDVEPGRILFFDDSPQNIAGAQLAGMQAKIVDSAADVESVLRLLQD